MGVDLFIDWEGSNPNEIGDALSDLNSYNFKLKMITNRKVKVYPNGLKETYCTDHWRCRFVAINSKAQQTTPIYDAIEKDQIIALLSKLNSLGFNAIKTENSYEYDGKRGFSLGQGE